MELFRLRRVKNSVFDLLRRRIGFQGTLFIKVGIFSTLEKSRKFFLGKIFIPRKAISRVLKWPGAGKRRRSLIQGQNRWIRDIRGIRDFCGKKDGWKAIFPGFTWCRPLPDHLGPKMGQFGSNWSQTLFLEKWPIFSRSKGQKGSEGTGKGVGWRGLEN